MSLALSFILFAILGAVYGAILYGLQPPIIGDLPRGNDDIDASYITISSEYMRMSERTCSSGIAPSVLILYPLSVFALNCAQSKIPLTIALLLCATIGYIFLDIRMTRVGLFQSAGMSALAVLLAVVVIAAIALMAYAAKMIIKNVKSPRD